jgi:uncharacterized damage-inducible protein DinB
MNPSDAQTIAKFLVADFADEIQTTARVLGAVPIDRLDYRPDPKSKTALGLIRHITLEDEWFLKSIVAGSFNPPPDDSDACGILTPADAVACYGKRISAALDRVRQLTPDQLTRTVDLFGIVQGPAVQFIGMALKHSVHHRGQLSAYLRAMGGTVPGIYGPSADTRQPAAATAN